MPPDVLVQMLDFRSIYTSPSEWYNMLFSRKQVISIYLASIVIALRRLRPCLISQLSTIYSSLMKF
ncbi:unnamed protein product [Acanthoscelides obtectus]|uniref:Uncharacterized protein n=1 Tax=Acanthoscelides obtectus TaxID=200917 RepID=A0A9P0KNT5_ACAOB|nr:unnamed protein product [Acanthoscelides obtectus]CAK1640111.1 hypothetical protein AOBTE_LOCUS11549 [Acanthoscelides obtectus]